MPTLEPSPTPSIVRTRCSIPASIILSPREIKRYKQWQRQTTTLRASEQGFLPTAIEYDDFQQWSAKHDSGYFSDIFEDIAAHIKTSNVDSATEPISPSLPAVATICQHLLHPGETTQTTPRCPVCTITVHLNYLELIKRVLTASSGHSHRYSHNASSQREENAYQAWCRGKLDTMQELSRLERLAEKAQSWCVEHPKQDIGDVKTSQEALNIYWTEITQPLDTSQSSQTHEHKPKKNRSVSFTEDTDFEPGRPEIYFWRRSPRYDPGKYVVAGENKEAEAALDSEDLRRLKDTPDTQKEKSLEKKNRNQSHPVRNIEDGSIERDGQEWEDIEIDGEEPVSDEEVDDGEYVVFEDDEDDDDEGSFIVFDD